MYPVALVGCLTLFYTKNSALQSDLDKKYTPIWVEISAKALD